MGPVGYVIATGLGNSIGGVFAGVSNLMNGKWSRDLTRQLHAEDRADAALRFGKDFDLKSRQFAWTQQEAEAAVMRRLKERAEDLFQRMRSERQGQAHDHMRQSIKGSVYGIWENDPYASSNSGAKSLRILVLSSEEITRIVHAEIERDINSAIHLYEKQGDHHKIMCPTGAWTQGAQSGSRLAFELAAWNPEVPTLILRSEKSIDGSVVLLADLFGFPMGGEVFKQGVELARLPADPKEIARVMSLTALAASDMYYLSNYGRAPLLPAMLAQFAPAEGKESPADGAIAPLVAGYQRSVNKILEDTPEAGLFVALQLAESLAAFPDKSHALNQVKAIEEMARDVLPRHLEVVERLKALYTQVGAPDDATRLQRMIEEKKRSNEGGPNLEELL